MASQEPAIQGEVLPVRSNPNLSQAQLQAAVVDATGATREEIAKVVGTSEASITAWRRKPEYQGEVQRLKQQSQTVLFEAVKRMHENLLDGANDAIRTLRDNLDAIDSRGRPAYAVRHKAAETLLQHGVDVERESRPSAAGAAAPNQAVVVVIKDD